jgi:hypothetical protein
MQLRYRFILRVARDKAHIDSAYDLAHVPPIALPIAGEVLLDVITGLGWRGHEGVGYLFFVEVHVHYPAQCAVISKDKVMHIVQFSK